MKENKNELDVDFIGGQGPLTKEEEMAISEFIKNEKAKHEKQQAKLAAFSAKRRKLQHN